MRGHNEQPLWLIFDIFCEKSPLSTIHLSKLRSDATLYSDPNRLNQQKKNSHTLLLKNLQPHHWSINGYIMTIFTDKTKAKTTTRAITKQHFTNLCSSKLNWPTLTAKTLLGESCLALLPLVLHVSVALRQSKLVLAAKTKIKFTKYRVIGS